MAEIQTCIIRLDEHILQIGSQEVNLDIGTEFQCPQCNALVSSLSALKTHFAVKHGVSLIQAESLTLQAQKSVDVAEHSVDGAPICKHCRHSFRKWQSFKKHIASHCPALHNYERLTQIAQENVDHSQPSAQPSPDAALLGLSAQQSVAGQTSSADGVESSVHTSQQSIPIIKDPNIDIGPIHEWIGFAEKHGHRLMHHCILRNQWRSQKNGRIESHLRSCHAEHAQAMTDAGPDVNTTIGSNTRTRAVPVVFDQPPCKASRTQLSVPHTFRPA